MWKCCCLTPTIPLPWSLWNIYSYNMLAVLLCWVYWLWAITCSFLNLQSKEKEATEKEVSDDKDTKSWEKQHTNQKLITIRAPPPHTTVITISYILIFSYIVCRRQHKKYNYYCPLPPSIIHWLSLLLSNVQRIIYLSRRKDESLWMLLQLNTNIYHCS